MNTEHIEIVMNEFSEELKTTNKAVADMATAFNTLQHKVAGFEEKLANQHLTATADTAPIQDIVKKGITDALLIAARQPKSLTKKFQILLFPEQDAKLFYKIVFGRWLIGLLLIYLINTTYNAVIYNMNKDYEFKNKQVENEVLETAWSSLYKKADKRNKQKMDSAYFQAKRKI